MPAHPTIYAVFDENGCPQGLYPEPIYTRETAPPEAIEIPYLAYLEFLEFQGIRRWNGTAVEPYTPSSSLPLSAEIEAELDVQLREHIAIRNGIVHAVIAWSNLENQLAMLLGSIVNQQGGSLGIALYYSPSATETRLGLVNDALVMTCAMHEGGERVIAIWERINRAINRCKRTRNIIVHGNITTIGTGKKNIIRLTQPFMNTGPRNLDYERLVQNARKMQAGDSRLQMPGMSSHDISNSAKNFGELTILCDKLRHVMIYLQTEGASEPFHNRLTALEADLQQRDDRSTGGRKRAKPQNQPQPSDPLPKSDD